MDKEKTNSQKKNEEEKVAEKMFNRVKLFGG